MTWDLDSPVSDEEIIHYTHILMRIHFNCIDCLLLLHFHFTDVHKIPLNLFITHNFTYKLNEKVH